MRIIEIDLAERLLTNALGGEPALSADQITDLLLIAASTDDDGAPIYTARDLNRAVAVGWNWKSALTAEQYDLGAGGGMTLDRSQWFAHCQQMATAYSTGAADILGEQRTRGGVSSIGMVSTGALMTEEYGG